MQKNQFIVNIKFLKSSYIGEGNYNFNFVENMIGQVIGNYKIIRLIGEGGMASVYEAEHEMLGTKVAIKVLSPVLSSNSQIKERFINEAKLMASLDHANITKVLDFDEQPQQLSILMEYLNGEDLNEKIKRNVALPEKEVVALFQQILAAFQYAHEKGIVHRDIKPSNIFILPDGRVKILDFGIAKLFGQGNEMTQTGTQMGTPIYMSPEQVKADKSIDHRSDIYSLGVTMFYAINGKPPYEIDTISQYEVFKKIVEEPLPELSTETKYASMIKRACAKDREGRFQSCEEWLRELNFTNTNHKNEKNISFRKVNKENNRVDSIYNEIIKNKHNHKKNKKWLVGVIALLLITISFLYYLSIDRYKSVKIGNQIWMQENLDLEYFRNGDKIPQAQNENQWMKAVNKGKPIWCYKDFKSKNGPLYGKIYNYYALIDKRGLAPKGWHIPNDSDWNKLLTTMGGFELAGKKLKSNTGWKTAKGTNSSGFNAKPGNILIFYIDLDQWYGFSKIEGASFWCNSTQIKAFTLTDKFYPVEENNALNKGVGPLMGCSVRCLKD